MHRPTEARLEVAGHPVALTLIRSGTLPTPRSCSSSPKASAAPNLQETSVSVPCSLMSREFGPGQLTRGWKNLCINLNATAGGKIRPKCFSRFSFLALDFALLGSRFHARHEWRVVAFLK